MHLQRGAGFQAGQLQHLVDQPLHPFPLLADAGQEATRHRLRGRLLQQLGGAAQGGQRALQLVGQAVHILLDIGLALELAAHVLQRLAQTHQLRAAQSRQRDRLAAADRAGVILQTAQRAVEPPDHAAACGQGDAQQQDGGPLDGAFTAGDDRIHGAIGFAHRQHAADLAVLQQGGCDIHHRTLGIVGNIATAAGAIAPLQGQVDIVPARVIGAEVAAGGVKQHDAVPIGDVEAIVDAILLDAIDAGADRPLVQGDQGAGQGAVGQAVAGQRLVGQIGRRQLGQQLGGIDQGPLGGAAHPGLDLLQEDVEDKPGGNRHQQEEAEQQTQTQAHGEPLNGCWRLMPTRSGCSRGRDG